MKAKTLGIILAILLMTVLFTKIILVVASTIFHLAWILMAGFAGLFTALLVAGIIYIIWWFSKKD